MVETIVFNSSSKPARSEQHFAYRKGFTYWAHMTKNDENVENILMKVLNKDTWFVDDLLEEQRPNIIKYENLDIVVLSFPSTKSNVLQITFIISKSSLITISNRHSDTIKNIMDDILDCRAEVSGVTNIFSLILDSIIEKSIKKLEELEDDIQKKEIEIFSKKNDERFLSQTNMIKEDLLFINKLLRGDLEVIIEILGGKIVLLNLKYFGKHLKDRILYLLDYSELIKESINNVNNIHMNMLSHRLNEHIYRLTIIGALMIIPTVIGSLFGMNVPLPSLTFWEILGIIAGLSIFASIILKLLF